MDRVESVTDITPVSAASLFYLGEPPLTAPTSAQEAMQHALTRPRAPRSDAYHLGLLTCLRVRLERDLHGHCPYDEGTAERDAFFAGVEEARVLVGPWNTDPEFSGPLIMAM